jgi:hypothetical protein
MALYYVAIRRLQILQHMNPRLLTNGNLTLKPGNTVYFLSSIQDRIIQPLKYDVLPNIIRMVQKNEMGRACRTRGEEENFIYDFAGEA